MRAARTPHARRWWRRRWRRRLGWVRCRPRGRPRPPRRGDGARGTSLLPPSRPPLRRPPQRAAPRPPQPPSRRHRAQMTRPPPAPAPRLLRLHPDLNHLSRRGAPRAARVVTPKPPPRLLTSRPRRWRRRLRAERIKWWRGRRCGRRWRRPWHESGGERGSVGVAGSGASATGSRVRVPLLSLFLTILIVHDGVDDGSHPAPLERWATCRLSPRRPRRRRRSAPLPPQRPRSAWRRPQCVGRRLFPAAGTFGRARGGERRASSISCLSVLRWLSSSAWPGERGEGADAATDGHWRPPSLPRIRALGLESRNFTRFSQN